MSDSILVRVTLDAFDIVHPSAQQTQVYVQIPEVARASWLLDASLYEELTDESWPTVLDLAHEAFVQRGTVSDSTSAVARKAVRDWLSVDENRDAVDEAWFADVARRNPVARALLADTRRLGARIAELEAAQERAAAHTEHLAKTLVDRTEDLMAAEARVAELKAAQGTAYRASHDSIPMGLYTTAAEARAHCEAEERLVWTGVEAPVFDWIEDEEDGVSELVVTAASGEFGTATGYTVTPLEIAAKHDPKADA